MLIRSRKNKSFSLLELIITLAILLAGTTVVFQSFSQAAGAIGLSCDIINAGLFAQDKMQEFEFMEKENLIAETLATGKGKIDKFNWEYTLNLDTDLNLYKLNFNILWKRIKRQESLILNTYLR